MDSTSREAELVDFLREITRTAKHIDRKTELARHLGMDGADAEEFLTAYSDRFKVDLSSFDFSSSFGPEAGFSPFTIISALFMRKSGKVPLTVGHLIDGVSNGFLKASGGLSELTNSRGD